MLTRKHRLLSHFFTSDKELAVGLQKSLKILNDKHICLLENEKDGTDILQRFLEPI